jgi:hypothetical protein
MTLNDPTQRQPGKIEGLKKGGGIFSALRKNTKSVMRKILQFFSRLVI